MRYLPQRLAVKGLALWPGHSTVRSAFLTCQQRQANGKMICAMDGAGYVSTTSRSHSESWMVCPQACLCCADPVMVNCAVWADGNTYEGGWKNDNISPGTKGLGMSQSAASRATEREKHSVVCNREPTSLIPAVCVSFVQSFLQCKVEPRLA